MGTADIKTAAASRGQISDWGSSPPQNAFGASVVNIWRFFYHAPGLAAAHSGSGTEGDQVLVLWTTRFLVRKKVFRAAIAARGRLCAGQGGATRLTTRWFAAGGSCTVRECVFYVPIHCMFHTLHGRERATSAVVRARGRDDAGQGRGGCVGPAGRVGLAEQGRGGTSHRQRADGRQTADAWQRRIETRDSGMMAAAF